MHKIILKNFSSLICAHIIYKLLSFFTFILIARNLSVQNFGILSFAISFVGLFIFFIDFGLNELLIRDVSGKIEQLAGRYITQSVTLKLVFSILTYGLITLCVIFFIDSHTARHIALILGICLIFDSFTIYFRSIFRLFEKMEFESISLICEAVLKISFIFIVINSFGLSILDVAILFLLVSFIIFLFTMFFVSKKFIKLRLSFDREFWHMLFKRALPFILVASFGVINFKISVIIVSKMQNDLATGLYGAAVRLIEPLLIIPVTAAIAIFSTASRIHKTSGILLLSLHRNSLRALIWMGLAVSVLVNIYAGKIISIVLGTKYLDSVMPLRLLSLGLVPLFIKFYLERFILIMEKSRIVCSSYIFGTLITIVFGLVLVMTPLGYLGAAVSLVLSEFFIAGYNFIKIRNLYEEIR